MNEFYELESVKNLMNLNRDEFFKKTDIKD